VANVTILTCACGKRLRAAGATPGRVGKCPACGGLLQVASSSSTEPEAYHLTSSAPTAQGPLPATPEDRTKAGANARQSSKARSERKTAANSTRGNTSFITNRLPTERKAPKGLSLATGILSYPEQLERNLKESLLYPLWGETGVAFLCLIPPALWISTLPALTVFMGWASGSVSTQIVGSVWLLPAAFILLPIVSFAMLYLGKVIASSAMGEIYHPRWPDWEPSSLLAGLGRWFWALLIGGVLGGFPAVAYWIQCGDIDLFDAVILVELAGVGAIYGQVALLASILYDDPLGAHPITVLRAIWRLGWAWAPPTLLTASFAASAVWILTELIRIQNPLLSAFAYWAYWVGVCYGSLVVLRILGLFYHRHAKALEWFRERPKWGG